MIITTTSSLEGYAIKQYLGVTRGMADSDVTAFAKLHEVAHSCLEQNAVDLGANAIIDLRYETISGSGATAVFCYGTAVVAEALLASPMP